jgi:hypothetical protein
MSFKNPDKLKKKKKPVKKAALKSQPDITTGQAKKPR